MIASFKVWHCPSCLIGVLLIAAECSLGISSGLIPVEILNVSYMYGGTQEILFGRKTKVTILNAVFKKNGQMMAFCIDICQSSKGRHMLKLEHRWLLLVRCDTCTVMSIKYGACLCNTCNMLVAQYEISADVKSTSVSQVYTII